MVAERIGRGHLGSLLRLTLLAPEILQASLDRRAATELTLPHLLEPFPTAWAEQCEVLAVILTEMKTT